MVDKQLLLGDEAVALGALHAGLSGVYAYPGTPSTEITEYIQGHPLTAEGHVHNVWSSNEKTAMEGALGMSYAGKRALVCMKHVGMNVCADPLMGSAMTGANGGLVVAACDDPSMHSSQNEQDSRFWGTFGMMPVFEPSSQQEAYEMTRAAYDYSEENTIPVIMRLTTRMAHSRAVVTPTGDIRPQNELHYPEFPKRWVTLPVNARVRNRELIKLYAKCEADAVVSKFNRLTDGPDHSMGVIACGIAYNYLMENYPDGCPYPVLKVSQYPFPRELALKLADMVPTILVLEEGQPLVETMLRGVFPVKTKIIGRIDNAVVRDGELSPDAVRGAREKERALRKLPEGEALEEAAWDVYVSCAPKKENENDLTYIPVNDRTRARKNGDLMILYRLLPEIAVEAWKRLHPAPETKGEETDDPAHCDVQNQG